MTATASPRLATAHQNVAFLPPRSAPSFRARATPSGLSPRKRAERRGRPACALRRHVIGKSAVLKERVQIAERDDAWQRITISRAIVIFADYLADLVVLDLATDVVADPAPAVALLAVISGLVGSVLAADIISAVAAWLHWNYAPEGAFEILATLSEDSGKRDGTYDSTADFAIPRRPSLVTFSGQVPKLTPLSALEFTEIAVPLVGTRTTTITNATSLVDVHQEQQSVQRAPRERDVFEVLVNSCALCTPPLTVLAGWTSSVSGTPAVLAETFFIGTLSLCALVPVLRAGGSESGFVGVLRSWGILKARGAPGWCQICGVWDELLQQSQVFTVVQSVLSKLARVYPQSGAKSPPWMSTSVLDSKSLFPPP